MKRSKYITAYSLIGLYVLIQIGIGVYFGLTTKGGIALCPTTKCNVALCIVLYIVFTLLACNLLSFGFLPMAVVHGSFSFGSWVWAHQHDLTGCVHTRRPRTHLSTRSASEIVTRLAEYGRITFGKSEEHVRGYCLNGMGSEIFGMAMRTCSYSIGDYYKNYGGNDFGCSRKTWGAVKDTNGKTLCYWNSPSDYICVESGVDVDDILMEMDTVLRRGQEEAVCLS